MKPVDFSKDSSPPKPVVSCSWAHSQTAVPSLTMQLDVASSQTVANGMCVDIMCCGAQQVHKHLVWATLCSLSFLSADFKDRLPPPGRRERQCGGAADSQSDQVEGRDVCFGLWSGNNHFNVFHTIKVGSFDCSRCLLQ